LINALEDPELRCILRTADLVIPDGMPLIWASRMMGSPLPERVTGADLVPRLAALSAEKGYRIFMLGAKPEVAQSAKSKLMQTYPGLQIVGCVSPPISPLVDMDHDGLLDTIQTSRPDILLVAFGNPKQEKWIHMNRRALAVVSVCIGVGATFDFIAGHASRAPQWMQKSGLEWVHRLQQEPKRLGGRYMRDLAHFSRHLLLQWIAQKRQSARGKSDIQTGSLGDFTVISIVGDIAARSVPDIQASAEDALNSHTDLVFDFHKVTSIDAQGIGMLINLHKRAMAHQREMRLACVPPLLASVLKGNQLTDGPYRSAPTLAAAINIPRSAGLEWQVRCGSNAALIEASGAADSDSVSRLALVCSKLLQAGRRVDLDLRNVWYVDIGLLNAVCRLTGSASAPSSLRIVPGDLMRLALRREKLTDRLTLLTVPEPPVDAEEPSDDSEDLQAALEPEATSARAGT
jgi:N-acetylglucosaminyldiphosphoundecaprenol N-acetyl-beta-D-mannosaminyltransferase